MATNTRELPIPGSVVLVDVAGNLDARHATNAPADIVLSPTPSNDINDPLNWTPGRKRMVTAMLAICKFCHQPVRQRLC